MVTPDKRPLTSYHYLSSQEKLRDGKIYMQGETVDDYNEFCHYAAGLVGLGLSKLFYASGKEDLASDIISNSLGLFLQKTNIIRDYLEDINEIPKSRMFWSRQIWSKYVNKLEDLKYEENLIKAVQCLKVMVTNSLTHVEVCLNFEIIKVVGIYGYERHKILGLLDNALVRVGDPTFLGYFIDKGAAATAKVVAFQFFGFKCWCSCHYLRLAAQFTGL
ncbi:hypothetical protein ACS0TY_005948 [Phlomoides rotata]